MGNWFSNLHIRKGGTVTKEAILKYLCVMMASKHFSLTASKEDSDGSFAILCDDESQWYSVYSDLFSFDEPRLFADYAIPLSDAFQTDILGLACFDSDFLFLNLIDTANTVDAHVGIGRTSGLGFKPRNNLAAWKSKVMDHDCFKKCAKGKYIFAESFLKEVQHCICLPEQYSVMAYEHLDELNADANITYLHFKLPEEMKSKEPPRFVLHMSSLSPCFIGEPCAVSVLNAGDASKGVSVFFTGPYVEKEEITFSNVGLVDKKSNETIPFELKKVQLSDGQWAYHFCDPDYKIPPKVNDQLPPRRASNLKHDRSIIVRFVPQGNPRKVLDITVHLIPGENFGGQAGWNVWHRFGSKKEYIHFFNDTWEDVPSVKLLKEEDFD